MKQHANVVAGLPQEVADFGCRKLFDLPEVEDFSLQRREAVEALSHGQTGLARCCRAIRSDRRPGPPASRIETRFERVLE